MRLEAYVMLLFSISLVFYLLGVRTIGMDMLYNQQTNKFLDIGTILNFIMNAILTGASNPGPLVAIGLGALATLAAAYFLGFSAMFVFPIVIMIAIMNLIMFPMALLVPDPGAGSPMLAFYVPFVVIMNILAVTTIAGYSRGGS